MANNQNYNNQSSGLDYSRSQTRQRDAVRYNNTYFLRPERVNSPNSVVVKPANVQVGPTEYNSRQYEPFYGVYVRSTVDSKGKKRFALPTESSFPNGLSRLRSIPVSDNSYVSVDDAKEYLSKYVMSPSMEKALENALRDISIPTNVQYLDLRTGNTVSPEEVIENATKSQRFPSSGLRVLATKDSSPNGISISNLEQTAAVLKMLNDSGLDYDIKVGNGHSIVAKLSDNSGLRVRLIDLKEPYMVGAVNDRSGNTFLPNFSGITLEDQNGHQTSIFHRQSNGLQLDLSNPKVKNSRYAFKGTSLSVRNSNRNPLPNQLNSVQEANESLRMYTELPSELKNYLAVAPLAFSAGIGPKAFSIEDTVTKSTGKIDHFTSQFRDGNEGRGSAVNLGSGLVIGDNIGSLKHDIFDFNHMPAYASYRFYNGDTGANSYDHLKVDLSKGVIFSSSPFAEHMAATNVYRLSQEEADKQVLDWYKQARLKYLDILEQGSLDSTDEILGKEQAKFDNFLEENNLDLDDLLDLSKLKIVTDIVHQTIDEGNITNEDLLSTLSYSEDFASLSDEEKKDVTKMAFRLYRQVNEFTGSAIISSALPSDKQQTLHELLDDNLENDNLDESIFIDSIVNLTQGSNSSIGHEFSVINALKQSSYKKYANSLNEFDAARVAERMVDFDPKTAHSASEFRVLAKSSDPNDPNNFKADLLDHAYQVLSASGIKVDPKNIQLDSNGVLHWSGVRTSYNSSFSKSKTTITRDGQEVADTVSGTIGQLFVPNEAGIIETKYNTLSNTPSDVNEMLVPGYTGIILSPKEIAPGEWDAKALDEEFKSGVGANNRLRVLGYRQHATRQIGQALHEQIFNARHGDLTRPQDTTILNKLYHGNVAVSRVDKDDLTPKMITDPNSGKVHFGLDQETIEAKISDDTRRVRFPNAYSNGTGVLESWNFFNQARNLFLKKKLSDPKFDIDSFSKGEIAAELQNNFSKLGMRNRGVLANEQDKGYFSATMTSQGKGQGSVRFLSPDAKINPDGSVEPARDENGNRVWSKSATERLPIFKYLASDPADRAMIGTSQAKRAKYIDYDANTAFFNATMFNMEDGNVVSKRFAEAHPVADQDGNLRPLQLGDKLSDGGGNKSTIAAIIDPDMDPLKADKQGILPLVQLFKQNPELDVGFASSSQISRKSASGAHFMLDSASSETMKYKPYLRDENGELIQDEQGNFKLSSEEIDTDASLGKVPVIVTDITVDSKSHLYNSDDPGRKFSILVANAHAERGANKIAQYMYSKDPKRMSAFREYLLTCGMDILADGTPVPRPNDLPFANPKKTRLLPKSLVSNAFHPEEKRKEYTIDLDDSTTAYLNTLQYAQDQNGYFVSYVKKNGSNQNKVYLLNSDLTVNRSGMSTMIKDIINNQAVRTKNLREGDFNVGESFVKQISASEGDIILPKVAGHPLFLETPVTMATDRISVLPPSLRQNKEQLDGQTLFHNFTSHYQRLGVDLYRYKAAMTVFAKQLPPGLSKVQRQNLMLEASHMISDAYNLQRDYDVLTTDIADKILGSGGNRSVRNSFLRNRIASTRVDQSATLVMTNGANVPLDAIEVSPLVARHLGFDFDPETGKAWMSVKPPENPTPESIAKYEQQVEKAKKNMDMLQIHRDPVWNASGVLGVRLLVNPDLGDALVARVNPVTVSLMDGDYDGDQIGLMSIPTLSGQRELHNQLSVAQNVINLGSYKEKNPTIMLNISKEFVDIAARTNFEGCNDPKKWQELSTSENTITNTKDYLNTLFGQKFAQADRKARTYILAGKEQAAKKEYDSALAYLQGFYDRMLKHPDILADSGVNFSSRETMMKRLEKMVADGVKGKTKDLYGPGSFTEYLDQTDDSEVRYKNLAEVQSANKARADLTAFPGKYQQDLVAALRCEGADGMRVANELGKSYTQATLQVKHEAAQAYALTDAMIGSLQDVYKGEFRNRTLGYGLIGTSESSLPDDITDAARIVAKVFNYAYQNDITGSTDFFTEQDAKELGLPLDLANKIITGIDGTNGVDALIKSVKTSEDLPSEKLNIQQFNNIFPKIAEISGISIPQTLIDDYREKMLDPENRAEMVGLGNKLHTDGTTFDMINLGGYKALKSIARDAYQKFIYPTLGSGLSQPVNDAAVSQRIDKSQEKSKSIFLSRPKMIMSPSEQADFHKGHIETFVRKLSNLHPTPDSAINELSNQELLSVKENVSYINRNSVKIRNARYGIGQPVKINPAKVNRLLDCPAFLRTLAESSNPALQKYTNGRKLENATEAELFVSQLTEKNGTPNPSTFEKFVEKTDFINRYQRMLWTARLDKEKEHLSRLDQKIKKQSQYGYRKELARLKRKHPEFDTSLRGDIASASEYNVSSFHQSNDYRTSKGDLVANVFLSPKEVSKVAIARKNGSIRSSYRSFVSQAYDQEIGRALDVCKRLESLGAKVDLSEDIALEREEKPVETFDQVYTQLAKTIMQNPKIAEKAFENDENYTDARAYLVDAGARKSMLFEQSKVYGDDDFIYKKDGTYSGEKHDKVAKALEMINRVAKKITPPKVQETFENGFQIMDSMDLPGQSVEDIGMDL